MAAWLSMRFMSQNGCRRCRISEWNAITLTRNSGLAARLREQHTRQRQGDACAAQSSAISRSDHILMPFQKVGRTRQLFLKQALNTGIQERIVHAHLRQVLSLHGDRMM